MKRKEGRYAKKNIKKQWLIVLGVLVALLLIELVIVLVSGCQKDPVPEQTIPPVGNTLPVETTIPTETADTAPETLVTTVPTTVPTETEGTDPTEETEETKEPDETEETEEKNPPVRETEPPRPTNPQEPDTLTVTFPYVIPNTELVVRYVDSYSGIFMEDGSDWEVENISAMVVTNLSSTHIEYANIYISRNGEVLSFTLSALPAGATMVVQEAGAAPYEDGEYYDCWCEIAELETLEMSKNQVQIKENEDGSLLVTNLTDETIPTIRIFYKFYMYDEEVYVCGITYTAKVQGLEGGASCVIAPSHYMAGASKIVMVRTYDTAN